MVGKLIGILSTLAVSSLKRPEKAYN